MGNYNLQFLPQYNQKLFCDIWDNAADFVSDMTASPLYDNEITTTQLSTIFYLLFAKYGNNPIASFDENNFKLKVASIIIAHAPNLFKKVAVQKSLRGLSLDDLQAGLKNTQNRALNDAAQPSTDTDDDLPYINEQVVNKSKRSVLDAYSYLLSILRSNAFDEFVNRFKPLFSRVVDNQNPWLYISDEEDDE